MILALLGREAQRRLAPYAVRYGLGLALVLPVLGILSLVAIFGASGFGGATGATAAISCTLPADPGAPPAVGALDAEQTGNAAVIVEVGKAKGIPARGWAVAIATSMQESGLRNLDYGDRDSLGLFQQRPSQGWGTPAQIRDPVYAAGRFYAALAAVGGWQQMALTEAAQAVQRSGFPLAYAQWESLATDIVGRLAGVDAGVCAPIATGPWTLPLPVKSYVLTSPFLGGYRSTGGHSGQDLAAPNGTPIYAASAGRVRSAGPAGPYGNLVIVEHADGVSTYYAHQCDGCIVVTAGQPVEPGTVLGAVGNTGNVYGANGGFHLHFEVRVSGQPIDPLPWLTAHGVTY